MEVPSYTSNIQPYGSQSGTKLVSSGDGGKGVSSQETNRNVHQTEKANAQISEQLKRSQEKALQAAVQQSQERERLNEQQRAVVIEKMDEFVNSINTGLAFRLDEELGRDVVTIYEASTGDVIRQIPEEEILEVLRRLSREQSPKSGLLVIKA